MNDRITAIRPKPRTEAAASWKKLTRKQAGLPRTGMCESHGTRERAWHCE